MTLRPVSLAVLAFAATFAATVSSSASADAPRHSYIVQLTDKPVATYNGEVAGFAATKPPAGQRLNVDAATVQNYISYLDSRQQAVLATVAGAPITHRYNVVFNGFAAQLTDAEVRALKKHGGVINISADSVLQPDTVTTPTFVGLTQPGGLWQQLGGPGSAGENMIVGIVDGGIWPEHPSFADRVDATGAPSRTGATLVYSAPPANWKGTCVTGEGWTASDCNNKLIGARFFKNPAQQLHWTEFLSPRDSVAGPTGHGGHGTHTASTAAGNGNVKVVQDGITLGNLSGIAPRARIAAYKVCWTDKTTGRNGCDTSNSVAAIEQAVKDGVNVINFSIGPSSGGGAFNEPTEVAFLGAASAGVFVATSAGNSGPTSTAPAPTAHISPWLTSVGNSTHDRLFVATVKMGNGVNLTGASSNANLPSAPLILSRDAGLPGVDPNSINLARCYGPADTVSPLLDPAKVSGKILVCDRGANALVNKTANAKTAGALGAIIGNVPGGATTLLNAPHTLPTVHVRAADTATLKAYIAANAPGAATAALQDVRAISDPTVPAPVMNGSSSRGPNVANANILKPDLTAPGTDILAGVTADLTQAQHDAIVAGAAAPSYNYEFYTGTSMASPHVAGMAALLKQLHPNWTPAAIKSALMTTATPTKPDGLNGSLAWDSSARDTGTLPWAQGAGHVAPSVAAHPGLVYDMTEIDYARFLCGLNANVYSPATCSAIGTVAPYNLNLASITAADVLGTLTLKRTVTNVGESSATYASTATLPGFTVQVVPPTLTLAPGEKGSFTVKLTRTSAVPNTWSYGQLVWSDGTTNVRSPLTARSSALAAPETVVSEAADGSKVITIGTGFTGALGALKSGLLPATRDTRSVGEATLDSDEMLQICRTGGNAGIVAHSVSIPANTMLARFSLFDADTSGGSDSDLDLMMLDAAGNLVAQSGNGGSNERVQLSNPPAGNYTVCVVGYAPDGGNAQYTLSSWVLVRDAISGNFKVTLPAIVYTGGTGSVSMSWSGLAANTRHLGLVRYMNNGTAVGNTVVEVDTSDPLPAFDTARTTSARAR